jgi:hypothetical protein
MKTLKRLLLLAPLALAGACVDTNAPVQLFSVCAPPAADNCTFSATCDAQYIGVNTVDLAAAPQRFWIFVEVHNQLVQNDDGGIGRVNTNDAYLQEVHVTYRGLPLDPTAHLLQSVVPANGTSVVSLFPMTEATIAQLGTLGLAGTVDLVAVVTVKGILGDGSKWESAPWELPIRVCTGCIGTFGCPTVGDILVNCPPTPNGAQLPASYACVTP